MLRAYQRRTRSLHSMLPPFLPCSPPAPPLTLPFCLSPLLLSSPLLNRLLRSESDGPLPLDASGAPAVVSQPDPSCEGTSASQPQQHAKPGTQHSTQLQGPTKQPGTPLTRELQPGDKGSASLEPPGPGGTGGTQVVPGAPQEGLTKDLGLGLAAKQGQTAAPGLVGGDPAGEGAAAVYRGRTGEGAAVLEVTSLPQGWVREAIAAKAHEIGLVDALEQAEKKGEGLRHRSPADVQPCHRTAHSCPLTAD